MAGDENQAKSGRLQLARWQWTVLVLPIVSIVGFVLVAAASQIHAWGLSWIWVVVGLMLLAWRWLLVQWTQPDWVRMQALMNEVSQELDQIQPTANADVATRQAEAALQAILDASRSDPPIWEDWAQFWARCQELVEAIAGAYFPEQKRPLLNIYVPQAYGLLRGTVDDLDQWMQKLGPVLNQLSIGQAYQAYELYQKWEPSARKAWRVWSAARWLLNPVAAAATLATQKSRSEANQQLLGNLSQLLREAALQNLGYQAIALYGNRQNYRPSSNLGVSPANLQQAPVEGAPSPARLNVSQTQTLRDLLQQQPAETVQSKPVNILLAGRTGAGKSSLINTLFISQAELKSDLETNLEISPDSNPNENPNPNQPTSLTATTRASVDVLPSTNQLTAYHWQSSQVPEHSLVLWDSPGYEQSEQPQLRQQVLAACAEADVLLLVTPALDPALQMDLDFLSQVKAQYPHLPVIGVVSQVDKLRPLREWQPPYDWQWGDRPKEVSMRDALTYRQNTLAQVCDRLLPLVNQRSSSDIVGTPAMGTPAVKAWGDGEVAQALVEAIAPAQKARLARFLRDLDSRTAAAADIIEQYTVKMASGKGFTALVKRPALTLLSHWLTGSATWGELMAAKLPAEQAPLVLGKLQMAYELWELLQPQPGPLARERAIASLWPLLNDGRGTPEQNAWAFGQSLIQAWGQPGPQTLDQIQHTFEQQIQQSKP
jgi:uncharacterized protein